MFLPKIPAVSSASRPVIVSAGSVIPIVSENGIMFNASREPANAPYNARRGLSSVSPSHWSPDTPPPSARLISPCSCSGVNGGKSDSDSSSSNAFLRFFERDEALADGAMASTPYRSLVQTRPCIKGFLLQ